jgi:hypothetical protein
MWSGDAEWPKVADAVIEAVSPTVASRGLPSSTGQTPAIDSHDPFVSFFHKVRQICLIALDTPLPPIETEPHEVSHPARLQKLPECLQKYGMSFALIGTNPAFFEE